jgi:hypothetical protein
LFPFHGTRVVTQAQEPGSSGSDVNGSSNVDKLRKTFENGNPPKKSQPGFFRGLYNGAKEAAFGPTESPELTTAKSTLKTLKDEQAQLENIFKEPKELKDARSALDRLNIDQTRLRNNSEESPDLKTKRSALDRLDRDRAQLTAIGKEPANLEKARSALTLLKADLDGLNTTQVSTELTLARSELDRLKQDRTQLDKNRIESPELKAAKSDLRQFEQDRAQLDKVREESAAEKRASSALRQLRDDKTRVELSWQEPIELETARATLETLKGDLKHLTAFRGKGAGVTTAESDLSVLEDDLKRLIASRKECPKVTKAKFDLKCFEKDQDRLKNFWGDLPDLDLFQSISDQMLLLLADLTKARDNLPGLKAKLASLEERKTALQTAKEDIEQYDNIWKNDVIEFEETAEQIKLGLKASEEKEEGISDGLPSDISKRTNLEKANELIKGKLATFQEKGAKLGYNVSSTLEAMWYPSLSDNVPKSNNRFDACVIPIGERGWKTWLDRCHSPGQRKIGTKKINLNGNLAKVIFCDGE